MTTDNINEGKLTPEQFAALMRVVDFMALPAFFVESQGGTELPTSHYPDWVRQGADKVNRARFPKLFETLEGEQKSEFYQLGVAFGMMRSGEAGCNAAAEKLVPAGIPEPTPEQIKAFWKFLYGENAESSTPPDDGGMIAKEISEEMKTLQTKLDQKGMALFYAGMADATSMLTGNDESTQTTRIYETMVIYWRVVEQLRTATELHDLLTRMLGQGVVGDDPQRISQMCRRIGKGFPPGRPKTTST